MQNIVIVAASTAGHTVAAKLNTNLPGNYRIVIIDPAPTSYWPIAGLRAAVVPGWEKRVYHKLEQTNVFPPNSQNTLVRQKVINLKPSSVVIEDEFEGFPEIPFVVSRDWI